RRNKNVLNPKRLLKSIVSWDPAHKALRAVFDRLPGSIRKKVRGYYSVAKRERGEVFLLDPSYSRKVRAGSEKARLKLGYSPHIGFERGMELTGHYLEWAY